MCESFKFHTNELIFCLELHTALHKYLCVLILQQTNKNTDSWALSTMCPARSMFLCSWMFLELPREVGNTIFTAWRGTSLLSSVMPSLSATPPRKKGLMPEFISGAAIVVSRR